MSMSEAFSAPFHTLIKLCFLINKLYFNSALEWSRLVPGPEAKSSSEITDPPPFAVSYQHCMQPSHKSLLVWLINQTPLLSLFQYCCVTLGPRAIEAAEKVCVCVRSKVLSFWTAHFLESWSSKLERSFILHDWLVCCPVKWLPSEGWRRRLIQAGRPRWLT